LTLQKPHLTYLLVQSEVKSLGSKNKNKLPTENKKRRQKA
jgi:hypothetical protein